MELFRILGKIIVDKADAIKALDEVTDKGAETETSLSGAFRTIGDKSIQLGKTLGIASAAATGFLGGMVASAANVKAMNSQFEQTFAGVEEKASSAMQRVAEESGIIETRLKGVGTSIFAFAKTTGMETPEALGMMERALKVTADSAAYYDRSLEETSESLKSFLKGNYENDAALGLSCTETTRNAAANKLYGKSFMELTEAQKQLTLLQMVEDANALSGALDQASRESDGWENVLGNLKEAIKQLGASLGEVILPAVTSGTQALTRFIEKLSGMGMAGKVVVVAFTALIAVASPLLITVGMLCNGIGSMIDLFGKLTRKQAENTVATAVNATATEASRLATLKDTIAKKLNGVATSATTKKILAFAAANKVALIATLGIAAPIIALAAYIGKTGATAEDVANKITAFADKLAGMITQFANEFPSMVNSLVGSITAVIESIAVQLPTLIPLLVGAAIQLFMSLVDALGQIIKPLVATLPVIVDAFVQALPVLIPALLDAAVTLLMALVDAIPLIVPPLIDGFMTIVDALVQALPVLIPALIDAAVTLYMALVEAIPLIIPPLLKALPSIVKAFKDGLVYGLSAVWEMIQQLAEKAWDGITNSASKAWTNVKDAILQPITTAKNKVKEMLDKIKSFFPIKVGKIFSNLKLPKITVDGGKAPWGIGGKGKEPSFGIKWNAKGAIFDEPTIFATAQGLQGVGEAGKEAVAPIDTLQQYVASAVASQNEGMVETLQSILYAIKGMDAGLYQKFESALDNRKIQWNDRELGRFVKTYA